MNDTSNLKANLSTSNIDESSYHLKTLSFEDSHVENHVPYASPSVLFWQQNKQKSGINQLKNSSSSDIERARGNLTNTNLVQIPLEQASRMSSIQSKGRLSSADYQPLEIRRSTDSTNTISELRNMTLELEERSTHLSDIYNPKSYSDSEDRIQKRLSFQNLSKSVQDKSFGTRENNLSSKIEKPQAETLPVNSFYNNEDILQELSFEIDDEKTDSFMEIGNFKMNHEELEKAVAQIALSNSRSILASNESKAEISEHEIEMNKSSLRNSMRDSTNQLNQSDPKPARKYSQSEASTQTSFVEQKNTGVLGAISINETNIYKKDKIKRVINLQKQQHILRVKQLEKLAQLEMDHAKRLDVLLENDTISSSMFNDTYKTAELTEGDLSVFPKQDQQKSNKIKEASRKVSLDARQFKQSSGKENRRQSEFIRSTSSRNYNSFDTYELSEIESDSTLPFSTTSISSCSSTSFVSSMSDNSNIRTKKVEVLNLKEMVDYQQPKNVLVIKESSSDVSPNISRQKQQQTNDFYTDDRGHIVFNVNVNTFRKAPSPSVTKYAETNVRRKSMNPIHYYFEPSPRNSKENKIKEKILKEKGTIKALQTMTLQEAFETFRHDWIARSKKRLKEIEERARMRQELAESASEVTRIEAKQEKIKKLRQYYEQRDYPSLKNYKMTSQEIKELTRRNYEKLPEVKEKQLKEKMDQNKKLNRLKTSIFKKTIQEHVLSKGTNFDLNFKAIEDLL